MIKCIYVSTNWKKCVLLLFVLNTSTKIVDNFDTHRCLKPKLIKGQRFSKLLYTIVTLLQVWQ